MTKKTILMMLALAALAIPAAVYAAQQGREPSAPVPTLEGVTSLTLSVTETQRVKQDVVLASLRFEAKGSDAQTVQSQINEAVKKGLDIIKGDKDIKIATEAYSVYASQNQTQEIVDGKTVTKITEEWRGSQALTLQSKDAEKMKILTGKLQEMGFAVNNFGYSLSPEKAEDVRQTLMKGAIDKIKAQADQATKLLGKSKYDIREVGVDGGYMPPMPMFKAIRAEGMSADSVMPAPNVEAGEQDVSMTLNTRVELR